MRQLLRTCIYTCPCTCTQLCTIIHVRVRIFTPTIRGELVPPEFLSVTISEADVGVDECVVRVRWSESVISCTGSVSQYVLSVTPPTSDCQSGSEDCVFMTDQTQYNLTVTASQIHSLTVRADNSFGNNIMGQPVKNVHYLHIHVRRMCIDSTC